MQVLLVCTKIWIYIFNHQLYATTSRIKLFIKSTTRKLAILAVSDQCE